ncbi:uncharacterized protein [Halyomorpha halys]|uniref:uncharacterized protein n=1 Tax=Halyomorpha halys TaxID=286706 RepID=UPI0006D51935
MKLQVVIKVTGFLAYFALALWLSSAQEHNTSLQQSFTPISGRRQLKLKRRRVKPGTILEKDSRFLPIFTIVQFGNDGCLTSSGDNGTCTTESECTRTGGVPSGPCARTFGVCCLFMATCGQSTKQNATYFVNPGYPSAFDGTGSCQLTIHKSHPEVCQYRIDFDQFVLAAPEPVNNVCNNDQFIVSGGNPIPSICGVNNGNHMYVNAGSGVNSPITLTVVTSGPSFGRMWKMKISQIPCNSIYRAEEGCLQYYTGVSGQVKSFNYDPVSGLQLSNQDYSACIRVERNFCGIQYTACSDTTNNRSHAFAISGDTSGQSPVTSMVGGMGPSSCANDWIIIPCATNVGRPPTSPPTCVDRICGGTFSSEVSTTEATVYSTVKPFRIVVHTDNVEAPTDVGNTGFCLNYVQQPCTTRMN